MEPVQAMYNLWLYLCQNNIPFTLDLCFKEYRKCVLSLYSVAQTPPNKPFIRKICMRRNNLHFSIATSNHTIILSINMAIILK